MGADFSISIRDVVKQYKIRHEKGRTLKEAFLRQKIYSETINALNHVSFDVPRGSTMGLIGSNGSGKSTILKMIAGTSKPNSGEVVVDGRISALLELGAGFHPDFSGRENVYLDGIIMGLSRREIDKRFDDIVGFAEMEEFIDAPAKTYSSGMFMRLAFSVAISVDPDILLIDEVLAVGDESFQIKCLSRINEFKEQGKTLLFVSHSMDAVRRLCDKAVWLDKGNLRAQGEADDVIDQYMETVYGQGAGGPPVERWRSGTRRAEFTAVRLLDSDGEEADVFNNGDYLKLRFEYRSKEKVEDPIVGIWVRTTGNDMICYGVNTLVTGDAPAVLPDSGVVEIEFEELLLLPGFYNLTVALLNKDDTETFDYHDRKYRFEVKGGSPHEIGVSRMPGKWLHWPPDGGNRGQ